MNDPRLQFLLDRYFDGALSEDERVELERILLSSSQGREEYWKFARVHADVSRWGQEQWGRRMATGEGVDTPEVQTSAKNQPSSRRSFWTAGRARWLPLVAAAAAIVLIAVWFQHRGQPTPSNERTTEQAIVTPPTTLLAGVAVLASSVDARWADGPPGRKAEPAPGTMLIPGSVLKLVSGAAQVEFFSGARLVLQGPVEIELRSEMEAYCRKGRLTAFVPAPARGFKVSGERLSIVDLGTEFGVNIPSEGEPEVHVFRGEVEVRPTTADKPAQRLGTGQGAHLVAGSIKSVPATPELFLREADYGRLADGQTRQRKETWERAVATLSKDSSALAHFVFPEEQFRSRTISNLVSIPGGNSASIVGCSPADGRWPLSRAVEFRGPGDRVRLDVNGAFSAITLLAWVRFDVLQNNYHAFLAPDGLADGTLRWGLTAQGELRLGIARHSSKLEPNWEVIMSPPVLTADKFGQWLLLASTFDGKQIRHYVNGELVKAGDAYTPVPVVIGPAEVGNWRGPTPRFFRGRMDEMAILSRAMSATELKAFYEAGRPPESSAP